VHFQPLQLSRIAHHHAALTTHCGIGGLGNKFQDPEETDPFSFSSFSGTVSDSFCAQLYLLPL